MRIIINKKYSRDKLSNGEIQVTIELKEIDTEKIIRLYDTVSAVEYLIPLEVFTGLI